MADHGQLIPFILRREGGPTMKGITLATYRQWCKGKGLPVPGADELRNIPDQHWDDIFKTMYWDRWQADRILSQPIANILVDWVWCSGVHGIRVPQRLLGVADDGIVGEVTLAAVNARNPLQLFGEIKIARDSLWTAGVERLALTNR